MSIVITPDYLRDRAVEAVKAYITSQTPLTDSVVSIARRDQLSPEQIARVVEVVNQVAYLKLLESAKDRTFEFNLADKSNVMEKLMATNNSSSLETSDYDSPLNAFKEDVVKSASEDEEREFTPQERHTLILKEYQRSLGELEKLANEERELFLDLSDQLAVCRRDEEILEKVAYITDAEEAVADISKMVFGHSKEASYDQAFYEDDLADAKRLISLFSKAQDVLEKKAAVKESINKANAYMKHVAKSGITDLRNNVDRVKSNVGSALPIGTGGKIGLLAMAPTFHPTQPIHASLHKQLPLEG